LQFRHFSEYQFKSEDDCLPRLRFFLKRLKEEKFDLVTADFAYVRWLGHRKEIERQSTVWDRTIVNRTPELRERVSVFQKFVSRNLKVFAFANNHCGPRPRDSQTILGFME
jgi:hypothetical protein